MHVCGAAEAVARELAHRRDAHAAPIVQQRLRRGADLTLACVLEQDSNTTLHWLLSCSNTSTA